MACTVYPIKHEHGIVIIRFVVVLSSVLEDTCDDLLAHIFHRYFTGHWGNHMIAPVPEK